MKECRKVYRTNARRNSRRKEDKFLQNHVFQGENGIFVIFVVLAIVLRSYNSRRMTSDTRKVRGGRFARRTIALPTTLLSSRRGRRRGACIVCCRRWKSARKEDIARNAGGGEKVEMVAGTMRKVCRRFLLSTAKRSLGRRYNWRSRAPDNSDDNEDKETAPRKKTMREGRGKSRERPGGCRASGRRLSSAFLAIIARESRVKFDRLGREKEKEERDLYNRS